MPAWPSGTCGSTQRTNGSVVAGQSSARTHHVCGRMLSLVASLQRERAKRGKMEANNRGRYTMYVLQLVRSDHINRICLHEIIR